MTTPFPYGAASQEEADAIAAPGLAERAIFAGPVPVTPTNEECPPNCACICHDVGNVAGLIHGAFCKVVPVTPDLQQTLDDLAERMRQAQRELNDLALGALGDVAKAQLTAKAEGVGLALSYVEEVRRRA